MKPLNFCLLCSAISALTNMAGIVSLANISLAQTKSGAEPTPYVGLIMFLMLLGFIGGALTCIVLMLRDAVRNEEREYDGG